MEHEPKPIPMMIEIGNHKLRCTPENTFGYLYEDTRFDHLFYVTEFNENGSMNGYHLWRRMLGDKFDAAVMHMINNCFEVESLTEPDDNDRQAFFNKYKDEPEEPPKLLEPRELTPREDRYVRHHGLFMQHVDITVEDFIYGTR